MAPSSTALRPAGHPGLREGGRPTSTSAATEAAPAAAAAAVRGGRRPAAAAALPPPLLPLLLAAALALAAVAPGEAARGPQRRALRAHNEEQPVGGGGSPSQQRGAGPTCLGVLVGIGTQKGGTTAAWAYIKHGAHPRLRVSEEKEIGFWDQLHGWHKGCQLGDYVMLLNGSAADPAAEGGLPLCPAPGSPGLAWASTTNRLRSSKSCGIRKQLPDAALGGGGGAGGGGGGQEEAARGGRGPAGAAPTAHRGSGDALAASIEDAPPRPWWWFFGSWQGQTTPATPVAFGHDGAQLRSSGNSGHDSSSSGGGGGSSDSSDGGGSGGSTSSGSSSSSSSSSSSGGSSSSSGSGGGGSSGSGGGGSSGGALVDPSLLSAEPLYHVDITPSYLYDPTAPLWVRAMLPEARILVILREPASRAVSNFNMRWQNMLEAGGPAGGGGEAAWVEALEANATRQMAELEACYARVGASALRQPELAACAGVEPPYSPGHHRSMFADGMVWQGVYADGLERWFRLFPAEQFMVWISEEFRADPAGHMRRLIAWLGLDEAGTSPKLLPGGRQLGPVHAREYEAEAPPELTRRMRAFFAPHNERLFEVLRAKGFGDTAGRLRVAWDQPAPAAGAT